MTKLLHTRPFNLEHARAGAPFCRADGTDFEVLKWDRKHTQCIVAVSKQDAAVNTFRPDGTETGNRPTHALVMTPLGFCEGKPVFAGDELIDDSVMFGEDRRFTVGPTMREGHFAHCAWPAAAPVYPETRMDASELFAAGLTERRSVLEAAPAQLKAIANAAIRHAVEQGQVVIPGEAVAGLRPFNPYTGRPRFPADVAADPMGHLVHHKDEPMLAHVETVPRDTYDQSQRDLCKAENLLESLGYRSAGDGEWTAPAIGLLQLTGDYSAADMEAFKVIWNKNINENRPKTVLVDHRHARDMAIAEAVRDAARSAIGAADSAVKRSHIYGQVSNLNLAAIVAWVKS